MSDFSPVEWAPHLLHGEVSNPLRARKKHTTDRARCDIFALCISNAMSTWLDEEGVT